MPLSFLKKRRSRDQRASGVTEEAGTVPRATSAQRVLHTYELLESILSFLPPHALGRARQVCQLWNDLIHRSRKLDSMRAMATKRRLRLFRLVIVGEGGSGRNSLITKWTAGYFSEEYDPTTIDHNRKQVYLDGIEPWVVEVIQMEGRPGSQDAEILSKIIGDFDAYVIAYSVSSREGFAHVRERHAHLDTLVNAHMPRMRAMSPYPLTRHVLDRPLGLIATKCDFETLVHGGWDVTHEEGKAMAGELGCDFYETSARSGEGVEEAFMGLIKSYRSARIDACIRLGEKSLENQLVQVKEPESNVKVQGRRRKWEFWREAKV